MPRVLLLGGAPRSGKSSAARRLAERLGYDTICIDDLVAAVRAVTTVASHQKVHAMTEIDYRDYYIQNTAETTPDAAVRMDRDFYAARPTKRH